jgi:glucose-1-phosphate adenylyltransferase
MAGDTLALILGGGQGSRLFPLTATRSKPAVPIGGKYRLIDVPVSNCLHADIRRIYVLTQFNSESLNRHSAATYRLDPFTQGFGRNHCGRADADNPNWFQGTADAVSVRQRDTSRCTTRQYYLILAGDHLYRMNYARLVEAHEDHRRRHHDRRATRRPCHRHTDGHLPFRHARQHRRLRGETEVRTPEGDRPQHPTRRDVRHAYG